MTSTEHSRPAAIRIVIAEDQELVRRGAALLISMEPDMEVVGQARNGVEAVELARLLRPDVVLMDLHMPVKAGVSATREITQELPGTQILVLTTLDDDETVFEAVRAGAQAYLLKTWPRTKCSRRFGPCAGSRSDAADRPQVHRSVQAICPRARRHARAPGRKPRIPRRGATSTPTH